MRRLIFLATVALTASSSAFAADLETSTVGQGTAVPFSRTGCFVGGHIGGSEGFVGGGQIGCDYQFAPQWIVGVGGQAAWATVKKTQAGTLRNFVTGATIPSQDTLRIDFVASATLRLGFGVDRWLFYVKGGAAWINQ